MQDRNRFDIIDQEQLAAQLVAVMDAHFQRPNIEEKQHILKLAGEIVVSSLTRQSFQRDQLLVSGLQVNSM
jgi:hypothetical protein